METGAVIVHEDGELELVIEQRRRLAIGAALLQLARASGRAPMAYQDGRGEGPIAEVRSAPDGTPHALLIALPHAEPVAL